MDTAQATHHVLTDADFHAFISSTKGLILVDFWAPWCGPCRMIAPVLEELVKEYQGKLTVAKMNIDENQQVPVDLHILSIPTLKFFKDGQEVGEIIGAAPKTTFITQINKLLE